MVTSDLTFIGCDRVLHRAAALGELDRAQAAAKHTLVSTLAEHWIVFSIDGETVERARRSFPREPIRTLDAIHLATALAARGLGAEMQLLSLDERIRRNAAALGFEVVPAD